MEVSGGGESCGGPCGEKEGAGPHTLQATDWGPEPGLTRAGLGLGCGWAIGHCVSRGWLLRGLG